jgi:hypothetical protein
MNVSQDIEKATGSHCRGARWSLESRQGMQQEHR